MKREMKRFHMVGLVSLLILGLMSFNSQGPVASSHAPAIAPTGCVQAPSGLVAWWPGDGNADDIVGGNNGTLMNGATFATGFVTSGNGQAFSLDGVDDFVNVPDSPSLDGITSQITVDAWINPQQSPSGFGWIFARRDPLVSEGFGLVIVNDGSLFVVVRTTTSPTGTGSVFASAPGVITFGQFQHVAATANTGTGLIEAYVNGQQVSLTNVFGPATLSGSLFNVNNLFIGRRQSSATGEGAPGGAHFEGEIDEVEVYSVELTQAQIQAIFNAGSAGKCKPGANQAPVAMCLDVTVSAGPSCTANASIDNGSSDPDGDPFTITQDPPGPYPLGMTSVTLMVTDDQGESDTCTGIVTVVDDTPPTVSCSVAQSVLPTLWPPNHNLVNVGLSVSATDNCDNLTITVEVFGDEDDEEPTGDGTHSPDAKDIAPGTLRVRSERKGDADGRVYLIVVKATDDAGNVGVACCTVVVPLSQSQADKDAVDAQAASARSHCLANNGAPPPGYFVIGDGPIIGPRQ